MTLASLNLLLLRQFQTSKSVVSLTSLSTHWAALSCRNDGLGTFQRVTHGGVTDHLSLGAQAGDAGLGRPHGFVEHDHPISCALPLLP